ncbi:MAG TPA: 3D domain-containing protein [Conexibacter sp.]|nr:3D domain-containing protein [Conexibacter sp.]
MTRVRFLAAFVCAAVALCAFAAAAGAKPIRRARWLGDVTVTEYYPVPEAWFVGKPVSAPGLTEKHRVDWLYSARGVSMQGTGIDLDGDFVHIDALGSGGWVTDRGRPSVPGRGGWAGGPPYWRAGAYWLSRLHRVTFPLLAGGWSNGRGRRHVPLPGVTFADGPSKPLRYYRSIAVDPDLIPLGSMIYIAAYRNTAGRGWFRAEDVGGAIIGRHVDVYRKPPKTPDAGASMYADQRIYVIPPGRSPGPDAPRGGGTSDGSTGGSGGGADTTPPPSSGGGAGAP